MSDTDTNAPLPGSIPIPRTLETPPRTTGNAQFDFPLVVDWIYKAYLVIIQAVAYINSQVQESPNLNVNDLPNPAETTLAQAQTTANLAYALADQADTKADDLDTRLDTAETNITNYQEILASSVSGTFTIADTFTGVTVTFAEPQPDNAYRVIIQPVSSLGAPPVNAFLLLSKSYLATDFTATMQAAPGVGNSVTFEWQVIRNT